MELKAFLTITLCLIQSLQGTSSQYFDGKAYAETAILHKTPVKSTKNNISVSFKTINPNGMILHGDSTGDAFGDYFTLEILGGKLRFAFSFGRYNGEEEARSIILGGNLADNKQHTVKVEHNGHKVKVILDYKTAQEKSRNTETKYAELHLDDFIYIGGAHDFSILRDIKSGANFKGCLSNLKFNHWDLLSLRPTKKYGVTNNCGILLQYFPFTLNGKGSQFLVNNNITQSTLRGKFKFRTYKKKGMILHQPVVNGSGFKLRYAASAVSLYMYNKSPGQVHVKQAFKHMRVNSGMWNYVEFEISRERLSLTVNNLNSLQASYIHEGFFSDHIFVGGSSFVGCLWDLEFNGQKVDPSSLNKNAIEVGICNVSDLCTPNFCQNGGKCSQDGKQFACDCYDTDYKGSTCQLPKYFRTCYEYQQEHPEMENMHLTIDPDGPGPAKPFRTFCNITSELDWFGDEITRAWTEVKSLDDNIFLQKYPPEEASKPESVIRDVQYQQSFDTAQSVARLSEYCLQFVAYLCTNSILLNKLNPAYGHWVGSNGWHRYYWGGAGPEHRGKCACGVRGDCLGGGRYWCNCDARRDTLESDEGYLVGTNGELLPVSQVWFGDVNIDQEHYANYTVGNLLCYGRPNNTATFLHPEAAITIEHREGTMAGDHGHISLFFRTPYAHGVIFQQGDIQNGGDFIRLEITNKITMTLSYNIGNGETSFDVSTSTSLADQKWHKVVVWFTVKEFGLQIDNIRKIQLNSLLLKQQLDVAEDVNIGGHSGEKHRGFIGCLRGMEINGKVLDLMDLSKSDKRVKPGCKGACDSHHCKHGGRCIDNYDVYSCDCRRTPFYGHFCQKDLGAKFKANESYIIYNWPSLSQSTTVLEISLGFRTKKCQGNILSLESLDQRYRTTLHMVNKIVYFTNHLTDGNSTSIRVFPFQSTFCDDKRHTIFIRASLNEQVVIIADGVGKTVSRRPFSFQNHAQLVIGGTGREQFEGCITGVKVTRWTRRNGSEPTVEPIKWGLYDYTHTKDITKVGVSRQQCGPEPDVPPVPTRPTYAPPPPTTNSQKDTSYSTTMIKSTTTFQNTTSYSTTVYRNKMDFVSIVLFITFIFALYW